jgi:ribosomal protein L22
MRPDEETPDGSAEDAATSETGRSSEKPEATAESEETRPVSAADAPSTDDADESPAEAHPEPVAAADTAPADEAPEPAAEADEAPSETSDDAPAPPAEKPKRARRPRRKATEPAAEQAAPAKPAQPAPTRRRSRREPGEPAPVVRAQAKYVRSSARKARIVCDHIRGKSVEDARAILALTPRAIASDWSKLLESAVANAEHNHELVGEDLYVKAVHADEGPTIKRFRPRAMGRATQIRKRTSHLTILLTQKN